MLNTTQKFKRLYYDTTAIAVFVLQILILIVDFIRAVLMNLNNHIKNVYFDNLGDWRRSYINRKLDN